MPGTTKDPTSQGHLSDSSAKQPGGALTGDVGHRKYCNQTPCVDAERLRRDADSTANGLVQNNKNKASGLLLIQNGRVRRSGQQSPLYRSSAPEGTAANRSSSADTAAELVRKAHDERMEQLAENGSTLGLMEPKNERKKGGAKQRMPAQRPSTRHWTDPFVPILFLLFFPFLFLLSLPERWSASRRKKRIHFAKSAFAAANQAREGKEPHFSELYHDFRAGELSRLDSAYNAAYLCVSQKETAALAPNPELVGIAAHPVGWYHDKQRLWRKNRYTVGLHLLHFLPRIQAKSAAFSLAVQHSRARHKERRTHRADNSLSQCKAFFRHARAAMPYAAMAVLLGAGAVSAANVFSEQPVLCLYLDGEYAGIVQDVKSVNAAKAQVEKSLSSVTGTFTLDCDVTCRLSVQQKPTYLSQADLCAAFTRQSEQYLTDAYGLYVDGTLVAVTDNKGALDRTLKEVLNNQKRKMGESALFSSEDAIAVQFANRVIYQEKRFPKDFLLSEEELRTLFSLSPVPGGPEFSAEDPFEVPSFFINARRRIEEPDELQASGPISTTTSLHLAPRRLTAETAVSTIPTDDAAAVYNYSEQTDLNFKVIRTETRVEAVPYPVESVETDKLFKGKSRVLQPGVAGTREAVYDVSYMGSEQVGSVLISQTILTAPVPEIVEVGTHIPTVEELRVMPTGTYIPPYRGEVSSDYGWRDMDGKNDFHYALDIRGPKGTPVAATDGGTVSFTGQSRGYGNYIILDHEDGVQSLYAHLNTIDVAVGDKVGQGDTIATIGNTGNAFGYHVHFEIRIDGVNKNPRDYLDEY